MAKKSKGSTGASVVASEPMSDKERQIKYQTEDDLRSLIRAEEIKDDPDRLKRAKALAAEQSGELGKVMDGLSKRGLVSDKMRKKMMKGADNE